MFENISVKTALKLVREGKAVLYDLREPDSYTKGHLPMAKNRTKDALEKELKVRSSFERNRVQIILYCDYGNLSMRVAKELDGKGYRGIASIVGGYHAYEGYVETQKKDFWTMEWKRKG